MKKAVASSPAAVALLITSLSAHAAYVVTLTQEVIGGVNDVVANGSGTIDLTDLTFIANGSNAPNIWPSADVILTGSSGGSSGYRGFTGPMSLGSGGRTFASSGSGDLVGVSGVFAPFILVPTGYVSGHALSDTATYDNATFASLGATPGAYVWTWGSGAQADSFTLDIVAADGGARTLDMGDDAVGLRWPCLCGAEGAGRVPSRSLRRLLSQGLGQVRDKSVAPLQPYG